MITDQLLAQRLQRLRCVIFDIDGVLTIQGRINQYDESDNLLFDEDKNAIKKLIFEGFLVAIISSGRSSLIKKNLQDIGIKWIYMGIPWKIDAYEEILRLNHLIDNDCAYMGDGPADLAVMQRVSVAVTVPHASSEIRATAHYCTHAPGACGAVREFVDLLLFYQRRHH
jgi:3-deoxy-D-manno-octulosonate 8-phosphate phosphatase (KDO 8-P phosphatase)